MRRERDPHADPRPVDARRTSSRPTSVDAAMAELLEGRVSDVQAAAFIVALRTKGETEARARRARARDAPLRARRSTVADGAIDTCGTGGDRSGTVNVSTMAALDRGGRGRAGREARQPRRVVAVRARPTCSRSSVSRSSSGPTASRSASRRPASASASRRATTRRCASSGPRAGDRRADHVQLPRSAREPGARAAARRSACRDADDGDAHARRAARARHRTRDGVLRRRRPRRAHHDDHEHRARAHRRRCCTSTRSTRSTSASRAPSPSSWWAATRRRTRRCIRDVLAGEKGRAATSRCSTPRPRWWSPGSPTISAPVSKSAERVARQRRGRTRARRARARELRGARPRSGGLSGARLAVSRMRDEASARQRRRHPAFPCSGCGRTLKVPEQAREMAAVRGRRRRTAPAPGSAAAPAPAAVRRLPRAAHRRRCSPPVPPPRRPSPRPRPRSPPLGPPQGIPALDYAATPRVAVEPAAKPPSLVPPVWVRFLLWIVAVPLAFLVVFGLAKRVRGAHDATRSPTSRSPKAGVASGRSSRLLPFVALVDRAVRDRRRLRHRAPARAQKRRQAVAARPRPPRPPARSAVADASCSPRSREGATRRRRSRRDSARCAPAGASGSRA